MNEKQTSSFKDIGSIFLMYIMVIACTVIKHQFFPDKTHSMILESHSLMMDFMGCMFIVASCFKIISLTSFANSFSMFDLIAKNIPGYAYIYPFIELGLGITYLTRYQHMTVNIITAGLMLMGLIGVFNFLLNRDIKYESAGTMVKPLVFVMFAEYVIMGLLAMIMLLTHYPLVSEGSIM